MKTIAFFALLLFFLPLQLFSQDVGITSILFPTEKSCGSINSQLTVTINNYSTSSVQNIPLAFKLNDSLYRDTFYNTLNALSAVTFTFKKQFNTLAGGNYYFKVYTTLKGDIDATNDTITKVMVISRGAPTPLLSMKDTEICVPDTLGIINKNPGGKFSRTIWYAGDSVYAIGNGIRKHVDNDLNLKVVSTYKDSGAFTTTFNSSNRVSGNMFEIKILTKVRIDSFTISPSTSGLDSGEFYYREGTYKGYQKSSAGWTRVGGVHFNSLGSGKGNKVNVVFSGLPLELEGGKIYSFYITLSANSSKGVQTLTNDPVFPIDSFYDDKLVVYPGDGICGLFSNLSCCPCKGLYWLGTIFYHVDGCTSDTSYLNIKVGLAGAKLSKGTPFQGIYSTNNLEIPDFVSADDTVRYNIEHPLSFQNAQYGSQWTVSDISLKSVNNTETKSKSIVYPNTQSDGYVIFYPDRGDEDSLYKLSYTMKTESCDSVYSRYVFVTSKPKADFSILGVCQGSRVNFINKSLPDTATSSAKYTQYKWYFGDGAESEEYSPAHYYADSGDYKVSLVVSVGTKKDSMMKPLHVYPGLQGVRLDKGSPFNGKFKHGYSINPDMVCEGDTLTYTILPPDYFGNNSYGKGWYVASVQARSFTLKTLLKDTATFAPQQGQPFRIRFIAPPAFGDSFIVISANLKTIEGGCDTTFQRVLKIMKPPIANFGFTDICQGQPTVFFDSSVINGGSSFGFIWDFGDGHTGTQTYPTHTYTKAGKYNVTLTAINLDDCFSRITKTVNVKARPQMRITHTPACVNQKVTFYDSTLTDGNIIKYNWQIGQSYTSTLSSPSYTFTKVGKYTISLIITVDNGCVDTLTEEIEVYYPPKANFTFLPSCSGDSSHFINTSTGAFDTQYFWDFGDDTYSTEENPSKYFGANAEYAVTLVVKSGSGCIDKKTIKVSPLSSPKAMMEVKTACSGKATSFLDKSNYVSSPIYTKWYFGDGSSDDKSLTNHIYAQAGTYTVSLAVKNSGGCYDSILKTITIHPPTIPHFKASGFCVGSATVFVNSTLGSGGAMVFDWDFGDGSAHIDVENPNHTYTVPGTYTVKLSVEEGGCKETKDTIIEIKAAPSPEFLMDITGKKATFIPETKDYSQYIWDFGDGDSSTDVSPTHFYKTSSGTYTVTLKVVDKQGCEGLITKVITLNNIQEINTNKWDVQIYPNPFDGSTTLSYELPKRSIVKIVLTDALGREVLIVNPGNYESEGRHEAKIEGKELPAGIYTVKMIIGKNSYRTNIIRQ